MQSLWKMVSLLHFSFLGACATAQLSRRVASQPSAAQGAASSKDGGADVNVGGNLVPSKVCLFDTTEAVDVTRSDDGRRMHNAIRLLIFKDSSTGTEIPNAILDFSGIDGFDAGGRIQGIPFENTYPALYKSDAAPMCCENGNCHQDSDRSYAYKVTDVKIAFSEKGKRAKLTAPTAEPQSFFPDFSRLQPRSPGSDSLKRSLR